MFEVNRSKGKKRSISFLTAQRQFSQFEIQAIQPEIYRHSAWDSSASFTKRQIGIGVISRFKAAGGRGTRRYLYFL